MLHEPAAPAGKDPASEYKKRVGVRMFIVYGIFYAGFVAINTVSPKLMGTKIIFDLNLAVVYGFGLILAAIISGLVYNYMCTKKEDEMAELEGDDQ